MEAGQVSWKVMVSPGLAIAMALRRDPGPPSRVVVTTSPDGCRSFRPTSEIVPGLLGNAFSRGETLGTTNPAVAGFVIRNTRAAVVQNRDGKHFFIWLVMLVVLTDD
jgi:hypothetical protein